METFIKSQKNINDCWDHIFLIDESVYIAAEEFCFEKLGEPFLYEKEIPW